MEQRHIRHLQGRNDVSDGVVAFTSIKAAFSGAMTLVNIRGWWDAMPPSLWLGGWLESWACRPVYG